MRDSRVRLLRCVLGADDLFPRIGRTRAGPIFDLAFRVDASHNLRVRQLRGGGNRRQADGDANEGAKHADLL